MWVCSLSLQASTTGSVVDKSLHGVLPASGHLCGRWQEEGVSAGYTDVALTRSRKGDMRKGMNSAGGRPGQKGKEAELREKYLEGKAGSKKEKQRRAFKLDTLI